MPAVPTPPGGTAARAARRHARTRRNLLASLAGALMLWAILANMGGTYAMWSSEDSVDAGTISTGTIALEATWGPGDDAQVWQGLLPGETAGRGLVVANIGSVPMELEARIASETSDITVRIAEGSCAEGVGDAPVLDNVVRPVSSADGPAAPVALEAGETAYLCVLATATESLTPGAEVSLAMDIEGRQIA